VCSLEKAEVWLEHNHRDRRYRIAWRTERLAASAELTAQIRPVHKSEVESAKRLDFQRSISSGRL